jgi:pimeloyl-ACP methyl ester carboxylesterase
VSLPSGPVEASPTTATFVLLPGAGGDSWYWHLVALRLRRRGHEVLTPDLPADDDRAGLREYADTVVEAIGDRVDVIVVAQSMVGAAVITITILSFPGPTSRRSPE